MLLPRHELEMSEYEAGLALENLDCDGLKLSYCPLGCQIIVVSKTPPRCTRQLFRSRTLVRVGFFRPFAEHLRHASEFRTERSMPKRGLLPEAG